jgi:hypothetical protein
VVFFGLVGDGGDVDGGLSGIFVNSYGTLFVQFVTGILANL